MIKIPDCVLLLRSSFHFSAGEALSVIGYQFRYLCEGLIRIPKTTYWPNEIWGRVYWHAALSGIYPRVVELVSPLFQQEQMLIPGQE